MLLQTAAVFAIIEANKAFKSSIMRECVYLGGDGTFSSFLYSIFYIGNFLVVTNSRKKTKKRAFSSLLTKFLTEFHYLLPFEITGKYFLT